MRRTTAYPAVLVLVLFTACTNSDSNTASSSAQPETASTSTPPAAEAIPQTEDSGKVIIATSSEISEADIAAAPRMDPTRAWQLVQSGEAVLVDVRSEEQFAVEHIPGSKNIPLWDLEERAPSELDPERWVITSCT